VPDNHSAIAHHILTHADVVPSDEQLLRVFAPPPPPPPHGKQPPIPASVYVSELNFAVMRRLRAAAVAAVTLPVGAANVQLEPHRPDGMYWTAELLQQCASAGLDAHFAFRITMEAWRQSYFDAAMNQLLDHHPLSAAATPEHPGWLFKCRRLTETLSAQQFVRHYKRFAAVYMTLEMTAAERQLEAAMILRHAAEMDADARNAALMRATPELFLDLWRQHGWRFSGAESMQQWMRRDTNAALVQLLCADVLAEASSSRKRGWPFAEEQ